MSAKQYVLGAEAIGSRKYPRTSYIKAIPVIPTRDGYYPAKIPFPAFVNRLPRPPKNGIEVGLRKPYIGKSSKSKPRLGQRCSVRATSRYLEDNVLGKNVLEIVEVSPPRPDVNKELPPIPESERVFDADRLIPKSEDRELGAEQEPSLEHQPGSIEDGRRQNPRLHGESITGSILVCYERPGTPEPVHTCASESDASEAGNLPGTNQPQETDQEASDKVILEADKPFHQEPRHADFAVVAYELPAGDDFQPSFDLRRVEADLQATLDEISPIKPLTSQSPIFHGEETETIIKSETFHVPYLSDAPRAVRSSEKAKHVLGLDTDNVRSEWELRHNYFLLRYRIPLLGGHRSRRHSTILTSRRSSIFRSDDIEAHVSTDAYHSSIRYRDQFESKMPRRYSAGQTIAELPAVADLGTNTGTDVQPDAAVEPLSLSPRISTSNEDTVQTHGHSQGKCSPLHETSRSSLAVIPEANDVPLEFLQGPEPVGPSTHQEQDVAPPIGLSTQDLGAESGNGGSHGPRPFLNAFHKAKAGFDERVKEARQLFARTGCSHAPAPEATAKPHRAPVTYGFGQKLGSYERRRDKLKESISRYTGE